MQQQANHRGRQSPAAWSPSCASRRKGRGGKTVTVVYDLPNNSGFLKGLAQELKRACGTGGAVAENTIELQGDLRERVREYLVKKGFVVKG